MPKPARWRQRRVDQRIGDRLMPLIAGFSLIEMLTVVVIIGIMAAIAAPGLAGWMGNVRMTNAVSQVQGALLEAQRQSIRSSRACVVTLGSSSVTSPCLLTGDRQLDRVALQASTSTVQFNLKGAVTNTSSPPQLLTAPVTIVLSTSQSSRRRCLVVSAPLGFVKTGVYSGAGALTDANCRPQ